MNTACKKNKKGFTLVELVVAMLIMSIVTASLSRILYSTYTLYYRSETTTVLFNVSQKLHIALSSEFSSCQDMYVYKTKPNKSVFDDYQVLIYVNDAGYLVKDSNKGRAQHVLLSEKSYRGAKVKSMEIKIGSVVEKTTYDSDTEESNKRRVLYITTVLVSGTIEYTHTSSVKLYNMQLWGTEVVKPNGTSYNDAFNSALFHYSQYYSFS